MRTLNPKVDAFLEAPTAWRDAFIRLRSIILDFELTEDLKWGWPCYAIETKNIVLMHGFKNYCALLFFKGALLNDPTGVLIQQTENVQAGRQVRFTDVEAIAGMEDVIKSFIAQAIEIETSGLKVKLKPTAEFDVPEEFSRKLAEDPALRLAFDALTPGRQRAYLLHFSAAKQSKTRVSRIETCAPRILDGKGLTD